MFKKNSYKTLIYFFKLSLTIHVFFIVCFFIYIKPNIYNLDLKNESELLIETTGNLISKLNNCTIESCIIEIEDLNIIEYRISNFQEKASAEKTNFSLVGDTTYENILLAITEYKNKQNKDDLLKSLSLNYINLNNNNIVIFDKIYRDNILNVENTNRKIIIICLITLTIYQLLIIVIIISATKIETNKNKSSKELKNLSTVIKCNSIEKIISTLKNTTLTEYNRSILNDFKSILLEKEKEKEKSDLYNQLYSIIGYEIRNITTTINGSIQHIIEEDNNEKWKSITSSVTTLSELANNYNQLLSQGIYSEKEKFSFLNMISSLLINLNNTMTYKNKVISYYIDTNLPDNIEGFSTNLFWSTFIQISNALNFHTDKKIFISIVSDSSKNIELTRVYINVYFLSSLDVTIKKITNSHWIDDNDSNVEKHNLIQKIIKSHGYYNSSWSISGKQNLFKIEFDVKARSHLSIPINENKKLIIYFSDSILQAEALSTSLCKYGIEIIAIESPNELFKLINGDIKIDAIIIPDTLKNIKLNPFIKTLKSNLKESKTKIFITINNNSYDTSILKNIISNVFYAPLIHFELVPELLKILNDDKDLSTEIDHKILIVEDDIVQQTILKKILSNNDYNANTVNNGLDAIKFIKKNKPNIIFMDLIMPIIGGIEATQKIRANEKESNEKPCIIIGVTALISNEEHKICFDAGMDAVIKKPYKSDSIIKVIKKYAAIHKI